MHIHTQFLIKELKFLHIHVKPRFFKSLNYKKPHVVCYIHAGTKNNARHTMVYLDYTTIATDSYYNYYK